MIGAAQIIEISTSAPSFFFLREMHYLRQESHPIITPSRVFNSKRFSKTCLGQAVGIKTCAPRLLLLKLVRQQDGGDRAPSAKIKHLRASGGRQRHQPPWQQNAGQTAGVRHQVAREDLKWHIWRHEGEGVKYLDRKSKRGGRGGVMAA